MKITMLPSHSTFAEIQAARRECDCFMFDQKKLETKDLFFVEDPDFDIKHQPLRLVVIPLSKLNRDWIILHDRFRRNTMIISPDDEVANHPELARFLETQGVALLMCKRGEDGLLSLESLIKSLTSLKFEKLLVEDQIDLLKFT